MNSESTNSSGIDYARSQSAFSLFEMLVSMGILSILLIMLMTALSSVSSMFINGQETMRSEEKGRAIIELFSREVKPAVIDTRMQFVTGPGKILSDAGATDVVEDSTVVLWMAPLGSGGDLRCVGYYLTRTPGLKQYRLKRLFIKADNPHGYFPDAGVTASARDIQSRTSAVDADWFTKSWEEDAFDEVKYPNDRLVVSTVSDGVVAFWANAVDSMGNPVPHLSSPSPHPNSDLFYNSASYFYMANGEAFEDGSTFVYLKQNRLTMKANRLPAALELAIVMVGEDAINRGREIPAQGEMDLDEEGRPDLETTIRNYTEKLEKAEYKGARVFRTTVKLTNGG